MKTDEILVTQDRKSVADALDKIELIARYAGMTPKDASGMRLLAEELLLATRNILEAYEGRLWMETEENEFRLNLSVAKPREKKNRDKLIALSSSGELTAPHGFFAKLGATLEKYLLLDDSEFESGAYIDHTMFVDGMYGVGKYCSYHYVPWNSDEYDKEKIKPKDELEGIEKSIIDAIVDDICVSFYSNYVVTTAIKKLK